MSFSLDDPRFSPSAEGSPEATLDPSPPPPSTGSMSSPAPLSDDSSACRNWPKCRRRMSRPVCDRHTVCVICRGIDCSLDSRCDECLDWSSEEMEAYIKHCLTLSHKDCRRKDSLPRPPSSPMSSPFTSFATPGIVSTDDRFGDKLAALSASFQNELDALSYLFLPKFASLQAPSEHDMSARMPNLSFSAPRAVPVLSPSPGLDLPPLNPGSTVGSC